MLDLSSVTACLNTKEPLYPAEVLHHVASFPFGEILVRTHSDSPHRKHELFEVAKYDWVYYQDDDAICPIRELSEQVDPDIKIITQAIKAGHFEAYKGHRLSVGLGWGAFFHKSLLRSLKRYTDVYGEDELFKRDTERILTYFNYPQNRLILPIRDLPSAMASDRLSMQPNHYNAIPLVEARCGPLLTSSELSAGTTR